MQKSIKNFLRLRWETMLWRSLTLQTRSRIILAIRLSGTLEKVNQSKQSSEKKVFGYRLNRRNGFNRIMHIILVKRIDFAIYRSNAFYTFSWSLLNNVFLLELMLFFHNIMFATQALRIILTSNNAHPCSSLMKTIKSLQISKLWRTIGSFPKHHTFALPVFS